MTFFRILVAAALSSSAVALQADEKPVGVELNKLEAVADGCSMHVVVTNPTSRVFTKYTLDLVIFDKEGVIARRAALDVSPVRADKTSVYAFNVKGVDCDRFGKVLLNDVIGCEGASPDCVAGVTLSTRAGVPLVK